MKLHQVFASVILCAAVFVSASHGAATVIGEFAGGIAEPGWGNFNGCCGVQPLDAEVYTVTDLGDGGALETNAAGFSDTFGYSFTAAGKVADFFANNVLIFDLYYRGTPTNPAEGGFSQLFQVLFQSNHNGFAQATYQQNSEGVSLNSFGPGGTAKGWGGGQAFVQTVQRVTIDYSSFKATLPDGFNPTTLQFWMSTNDSNRRFKAIDNVRLAVPEPTSILMMALGCALLAATPRRRS